MFPTARVTKKQVGWKDNNERREGTDLE